MSKPVAIGNKHGVTAVVPTCENCERLATVDLFGLYYCSTHAPLPPVYSAHDNAAFDSLIAEARAKMKSDNEYYEGTYRPAIRRDLQARKDGLKVVKARALAELRGEGNE